LKPGNMEASHRNEPSKCEPCKQMKNYFKKLLNKKLVKYCVSHVT
jgi:predicted flavoprotein YhiN